MRMRSSKQHVIDRHTRLLCDLATDRICVAIGEHQMVGGNENYRLFIACKRCGVCLQRCVRPLA